MTYTHLNDLFMGEELSTEVLTEALDALTADREALERLIHHTRGIAERASQRVEEYRDRYSKRESVMLSRKALADYDREELRDALESLHGDQPKLALENSQWETWCRFIVHVGIRTGHASDVHNLTSYLDNVVPFSAEAIFRDISHDLRQEDGTYPSPVPAEEAIVQAKRRYGAELYHPADPRLSEGWELIWRTAKQADLCSIWDDMADTLGVPQVTVTKSGYVTVTGTFSVSVYVEGVTDEGELDIDTGDVIDQLDRYTLEIDDVDTSELELD